MLMYYYYGEENASEGNTPMEIFEKDWAVLVREYSEEGIQISESPRQELSNSVLEAVQDAYESSRHAGAEKARELFKGVLEKRKESLDQSLGSLVKDSEQAELQNADQRKKPLSHEARRKASRLGLNIDLLVEYLSVSFDQLAAVTGLSRSSVYKMARKERVPKSATLYQLGIGIGVHPVVLSADIETLRGLDTFVNPTPLEATSNPDTLKMTTSKMDDALYGDPNDDKDPGDWLTIVEEVTVNVVEYYESNGGVLGAVIGRHHGGNYGAFLAACVAHRMRREISHVDLGGFQFPSKFVWGRIKRRMRDAGVTVRNAPEKEV